MAIVEAWLSEAAVMLPFNRDPGTAERFTELWAKAFKEVRHQPSPLQQCSEDSFKLVLHPLV